MQELTPGGNGAADHRLKYSLAWEEVDLLLGNASMTKMSFSPRPDQVPRAGGVFAETQGMHRRGLSVDSDRYISSGGNAGATRWPSFANSKIQRKYYTATVNGGKQFIRVHQYSLIPEVAGGSEEESVIIWHIPPWDCFRPRSRYHRRERMDNLQRSNIHRRMAIHAICV